MTESRVLHIGAEGTLDDVLLFLRRGELVVFPTDTVYGLAARADEELAVRALYSTKGRDPNHKAALLVDGAQALKEAMPSVPPKAMILARKFWPGQLTIVIREGGVTTGFRCPAHPFALMVAKKKDFPILITSANRTGDPDPVVFRDVATSRLNIPPALVIDGGATIFRKPSTVVEVEGDTVKMLREGVVSPSRIPFLI